LLTKEPIFQNGDPIKIWQKYCGFLDLSLQEFKEIQEELLMEEIELVADSSLGKKILKGKKPKTVEEFRRVVPLSTYDDYAPYIGECQEDSLPAKPALWAHTSGRGGRFKWIPYTERALERHGDACLAGFILAAAKHRGEVNIRAGSRFLSILAPRPYFSGISSLLLIERFGLEMIPPPKVAEKLDFQERIAAGFKIAIRTGVDFIMGLGTVLVKMGDRFTEHPGGGGFSISMLHPVAMARLIRALLRSKLRHRPMLPADIWRSKGIMCFGTDTAIYRDKIEHYWGQPPHEVYGCTEAAGILSTQSWARKGMVFYPYGCFFEFIPEEEWVKINEDEKYQPATVLIDEVKEGEIYGVVITSFHGMPLLRYRVGDLLRVVSLEESETGIKLPQFSFHSRDDGLIDMHNIVRLDERTIWQAMNHTNISYEDWSVRKEYEEDWPILRLYVEPKQEVTAKELARRFHKSLLVISPLYQEAVSETERKPVRVTILRSGSFQRYYERKKAEGSDLAQLKPPHMNAKDAVIQELLECSKNI